MTKLFKWIDEKLWALHRCLFENPTILVLEHEDISPWRYYDRDILLLYANFQVLVDYVEYEVGSWTRKGLYHTLSTLPIIEYFLPPQRDPIAGRNFLFNKATDEMIPEELRSADLEIFQLYVWWTETRPMRKDPWDLHVENKREDPTNFMSITPEYRKALQEASQLEEQYHQEDDDMLIRLMKVRRCLWT